MSLGKLATLVQFFLFSFSFSFPEFNSPVEEAISGHQHRRFVLVYR